MTDVAAAALDLAAPPERFSRERVEAMRGWTGDDWTRLLRLLEAHRLTPLAHEVFTRLAAPTPPLIAVALARARAREAALHARRAADLAVLAAAWKDAGVPWLPFKGAALAARLYGDPALRPSQDLDVLVPADRVADATRAVAAAGFVPPAGRPSDRTLARYHFHTTFRHPGSGTFLEIHWRLADRACLPGGDSDAAWFTVGALPDDAHLVYLCVHLAKHGWLNPLLSREPDGPRLLAHPWCDVRLAWLGDLWRLRRLLPANAPLADRARAWGVEGALADADRLLRLACGDAAALLDAPSPATVRMGRLERFAARRLLPALRRDLDGGDPGNHPPPWWLRPHPVWHVRPIRLLRI